MRTINYTLLAVVLLSAIVSVLACADSETYPDTPEITAVYFDKDSLRSAHLSSGTPEAFVLNIDFKDGDGDIGKTPSHPETNLLITDNRNQNTTEYTVPYNLSSDGLNKSISGTISVNILQQCCIPLQGIPCSPSATYAPTDELSYQVVIKDRAGNTSNSMQSPPLYLICVQ